MWRRRPLVTACIIHGPQQNLQSFYLRRRGIPRPFVIYGGSPCSIERPPEVLTRAHPEKRKCLLGPLETFYDLWRVCAASMGLKQHWMHLVSEQNIWTRCGLQKPCDFVPHRIWYACRTTRVLLLTRVHMYRVVRVTPAMI